MPTPKDPKHLIHELEHAILRQESHDEIVFDSKTPNADQHNLRFGRDTADFPDGTIGMLVSLMFDLLTGSDNPNDQDYPRRSCNGRIAFVNEEPPGWPAGQRVPTFLFSLQRQMTKDAQDGDEEKVLFVTDHGIWSTRPIYAPNLTGPVGPPPPVEPTRTSETWAPGGECCTVQQGDGNLVTYRVKEPFVLDTEHPIWSSFTGRL